MVYLIEAKWRIATSKAWTESRGTCSRPLTRVSCSRRHDTLANQRMDTLKIRSLPSPGIVTSKSTWCERTARTENRGKEQGRDNWTKYVWSEICTMTSFYCQEGVRNRRHLHVFIFQYETQSVKICFAVKILHMDKNMALFKMHYISLQSERGFWAGLFIGLLLSAWDCQKTSSDLYRQSQEKPGYLAADSDYNLLNSQECHWGSKSVKVNNHMKSEITTTTTKDHERRREESNFPPHFCIPIVQ